MLGDNVGAGVGAKVGFTVGFKLGDNVGAGVIGAKVGFTVGVKLGAMDEFENKIRFINMLKRTILFELIFCYDFAVINFSFCI